MSKRPSAGSSSGAQSTTFPVSTAGIEVKRRLQAPSGAHPGDGFAFWVCRGTAVLLMLCGVVGYALSGGKGQSALISSLVAAACFTVCNRMFKAPVRVPGARIRLVAYWLAMSLCGLFAGMFMWRASLISWSQSDKRYVLVLLWVMTLIVLTAGGLLYYSRSLKA